MCFQPLSKEHHRSASCLKNSSHKSKSHSCKVGEFSRPFCRLHTGAFATPVCRISGAQEVWRQVHGMRADGKAWRGYPCGPHQAQKNASTSRVGLRESAHPLRRRSSWSRQLGQHQSEVALPQVVAGAGTHLRRDTVIPQWFQASKATAASDGHAVHC